MIEICMKKLLKLMAVLVIILTPLGSGICQDIHFSQFYFSPLTLNPAHTGFFNGKHRFATNYKSQWKRATGGSPYVTLSASYDLHILDKLMKAADMTGFGVSAFSDKAGTGELATSGAFGSLAYHRDMLGNGTHLFSMGIQGGFVQMGFDRNALRFGDEILNDQPAGAGNEVFDKTSTSYIDVNAGVLWNYIFSDKMKFYLGASTYHLSQPKVDFIAVGDDNVLSNRISCQAGAAIEITRELELLPNFLYMTQDASNETNFGMALKYTTSTEAAIRGGVWYRYWENSDAVIAMMGFEYMDLTLGMSYDINISSLKEASNGQGSFEVALIYILKSRKAIVQDVECPHF